MIDLRDLSYNAECGELGRGNVGELIYTAKIPPSSRRYAFVFEGNILADEYFVLEYSTMGWGRPKIYRQPCIWGEDFEGKIYPFVCYDDMVGDGKRYTVVAKVGMKQLKRITVAFVAGKRPLIEFTAHKMYFCSESELLCYCADEITDMAEPFIPIDLSARYDRPISVCEEDVRFGGGKFFDKENICLHNIPFKVKTEGNNALSPPPPPAQNEEIIENFGVKAKRRICRPISRDGAVSVTLGSRACEIYFLATIEGKRYMRCGFASGSTILGTYGSEVTMPLSISDVEGFAVEIVYLDGRRDFSLPYNVSAGKFGMTGDLSLYAVQSDGSEISEIVFRNRSLDTDISIVAITLNTTERRLFPNLLIPEIPEKIRHGVGDKHSISLDGDRLAVDSGAIHMEFDLSRGLYLDVLRNDFTPLLKFSPDSLIKIKRENRIGSDIKTADVIVNDESATVSLLGEGLSFEVKITASAKDGISFALSVHNPSDEVQKQGIIFPFVSGIEFRDREDSWYFIPKYQNVNSNETIYVYEESAPSFPMQFLDVYSPAMQGGLALTTGERELVVRKYYFAKRDNIEFYVEYPEMYGEIAANGSFTASPTLLSAHSGDWRESFRIYKSWLDEWYEPYHCQDKRWYRESFWLLAEITDFFETEDMCRFPIWYDKEKGKFNYLDILDEQKRISGYYPDILHMWAWSNRRMADGQFRQKWGNFGESEYADYGGVDNFRSALHEFMEKRGVYSSVYLHPTLLTDFYPQYEKYKHLRVEGAAGNNITIFGDSHRMCHASEEWREYALQMYPRVYSELKVPILYVDEFSLRIGNRCYAKHHGHEVPSNLLKTDREFITRLKNVMPQEVVLYGEYAAVDVNARYIDCNISYSIIDTVTDMIETSWRADDGDGRFSRVITDVYRFAFPKIVQLVLPMAMRGLSWHPEKFIFFNGEAIYDSFWDIEESRGHEFICRAYGVKKKYADCFASDNPETMIDTLTPAVVCNKFPSSSRTVYTLYNRAYTTYRGEVLRIPHVDGAEYYNAWTDEVITPEIRGGYAYISLTVHAQDVGCVAVTVGS